MSNGQQFIQWLTDDKFASVEPAEQLFDGTKDVVIPASGIPVPMHLVGKAFIMLPGREFAMDSSKLRQLYPKEDKNKKRREPAKSNDDPSLNARPRAAVDLEASLAPMMETPVPQRPQSSFIDQMLSKAKKNKRELVLKVTLDLPSQAFYSMMKDSFNDDVVDSLIDEIACSVGTNELRASLVDSIKKELKNEK